jgi:hypothetical protein
MATFLTVKEASRIIGKSPSSIRRVSGRLKHHVLGRRRGGKRVSEQQLQEYLRETEHGGVPAPEPEPTVPRSAFKHMKV